MNDVIEIELSGVRRSFREGQSEHVVLDRRRPAVILGLAAEAVHAIVVVDEDLARRGVPARHVVTAVPAVKSTTSNRAV